MAFEPSVSCGLMRAHATTLKKRRSSPSRNSPNSGFIGEYRKAGSKVT